MYLYVEYSALLYRAFLTVAASAKIHCGAVCIGTKRDFFFSWLFVLFSLVFCSFGKSWLISKHYKIRLHKFRLRIVVLESFRADLLIFTSRHLVGRCNFF